MKRTIEIPDALFRRAKSVAAEWGMPFRALLSGALTDKLRVLGTDEKPWMKAFGKLRPLQRETVRINRIIEREFGRLEPEDKQ